MTTTGYCCAGMLKGCMSGIIAAHDGTTMLTIRLATDERAPGLQPYLILHYCPCCGARLSDGDGTAGGPTLRPEPPGRMLTFPDWGLHR